MRTTTTPQKVGIGATAIAIVGLLTAGVKFVDNHWAGTFGDGGGGTPRTSPTEQTAEIYLSRDAVPMDSDVDVSGEGFAPNQQVVIRVDTFEVARPTANAQGGFKNVSIRIPDFYAPFQKPMTVHVIATSKPAFGFQASRDIKIT